MHITACAMKTPWSVWGKKEAEYTALQKEDGKSNMLESFFEV